MGNLPFVLNLRGVLPGYIALRVGFIVKTTAEPRREIADVIGEISTTPSAERTDDEGNGGRPKLQTVEEVEEGGSTPIWSVLKKRAATTRK